MYNSNTGLNNHLVRIREQIDNSKLIRKRARYQALESLKFDWFYICLYFQGLNYLTNINV